MSMTQEQALKLLGHPIYKWSMDWDEREDGLNYTEALDLALAALHPVSRETVERIWFREPYTRLETRQGDDGSIVYSAVNTCMACGHETPIGNFCHNCGAAQTVEGVELTMQRLEALKDGEG